VENRLQFAISTKGPETAPSKRRAASVGIQGMDGVRAIAADPTSVLTLGLSNSPIALRSGVYFIALRHKDIEDIPNWQNLRLREFSSGDSLTPNGEGFLRNGNGSAVDFDYIALSIQPQSVVPKA